MKKSIILYTLLTGGFVSAAMSACSSDNSPIVTNPSGGGASSGGTGTGNTATGATGNKPNGGSGNGGVSNGTCSIGTSGYIVSGTWHGYSFPVGVTSKASGAATTTIDQADFKAVAAGGTLCVSGSIGAASDYGGVAMIGMNVNQGEIADDAGNNPQGVMAIGGSGITVTYTNPGATTIRVQIQTAAGETDPTGRWCATLLGSGGTETVPWSSFWGGVSDTTKGCWNSGGNNPTVGTEITQAALLVPGGNTAAVLYNFCLGCIAQAP
jgi:hypothetical protein